MSFLSKVNGAHSLVRIHSPSLLYLLVPFFSSSLILSRSASTSGLVVNNFFFATFLSFLCFCQRLASHFLPFGVRNHIRMPTPITSADKSTIPIIYIYLLF